LINTEGDDPKKTFDDFIFFCLNGKKDPTGRPAIVGGREARGVVDWLVHLPVSKANFFATEPRPEGTLFVATLSKNDVPWIDIPAFMDFVKRGPLPNFADENGQIKLASVVRIDDEFRRQAAIRVQVLNLLPLEAVESFSSALGETTQKRNEAVSNLKQPLQGQVRGLLGF